MLFPGKFVPQRTSKFEDNLISYAPPELLVLFALGLFAPGGLFEYALSKRYLIVGGVGLLVWTPFLWSFLILIHNAGRVRFWLSVPIMLIGHLLMAGLFMRMP